MKLYLIKDGKDKIIELENNNITREIKNPYCKFLDKYINKENYSLVIDNSDDYELFAFINKNITKEDGSKILNTVRSINNKKRIFDFTCCNYLEDDYDYINVFDRYKMENSVFVFCEEKVDNDSYYVGKILANYRNLNLKKCLLENYDERFPSNICRGGIIIGEDKRIDMGLNKRTHGELFDEYFNRDGCDIDKSKAIFAIVNGASIFIEFPKSPINSFQKEELNKINEEITYVKNMHMPVYLDILKDEKLYKDFDELRVKEKRKSIH